METLNSLLEVTYISDNTFYAKKAGKRNYTKEQKQYFF